MNLYLKVKEGIIAEITFEYVLTHTMENVVRSTNEFPDDICLPCIPCCVKVTYYSITDDNYNITDEMQENVNSFIRQNSHPTISELREYLNNK